MRSKSVTPPPSFGGFYWPGYPAGPFLFRNLEKEYRGARIAARGPSGTRHPDCRHGWGLYPVRVFYKIPPLFVTPALSGVIWDDWYKDF